MLHYISNCCWYIVSFQEKAKWKLLPIECWARAHYSIFLWLMLDDFTRLRDQPWALKNLSLKGFETISLRAVFHQTNFFARSDFFFCLMSFDGSIQFKQWKVDSRDKIRLVENGLNPIVLNLFCMNAHLRHTETSYHPLLNNLCVSNAII